jgi:hypothetical protein
MKQLGTKEKYNAPALEVEQVVVEAGFTLTGSGGGASLENPGEMGEMEFD